MSYPAYPEYKDSGVEWLGQVPAHWDVAPVASKFELRNGYPFKAELFTPEGVPSDRLIRIRDILKDGSRIFTPELCPSWAMVKDGDVLIGMDGDFNVVYWNKGLAKLNQRVCAIRGQSVAWDKFLFYGIAQPLNIINDLTFSTTVKHLSSSQVLKTRFPLPLESEVSNIVAFLDHETARIDALVEEQQRLIALLKEKRQAVISHAVTKGLDSNVPMKDSGAEWLGEVPEHWVVATLRRVLQTIEQGWSPECFNFPAYEGKWGVLKAGAVNNGVYRDAENKALPDGLAPKSNIEVATGDLLMCRASGSPELIGSAAYVKATRPNLMLSDKLFRLVVNKEVCPEFIALSLGSISLRRQIEQSINGAEGLANNLSQASIKNLKISVPPLPEQRQIVAELMRVLDGLKNQLDLAGDTVKLLQERRSALISAAVTGKIDVRGWQHQGKDNVLINRTHV